MDLIETLSFIAAGAGASAAISAVYTFFTELKHRKLQRTGASSDVATAGAELLRIMERESTVLRTTEDELDRLRERLTELQAQVAKSEGGLDPRADLRPPK